MPLGLPKFVRGPGANLENKERQRLEKEREMQQILIENLRRMAIDCFGTKNPYHMYVAPEQEYWYFSPRSREENERIFSQEGRRKVNELQDRALNAFRESKKNGEQFMKEHLGEICQEYKIHLQPTSENLLLCVERLLWALAANPGFRFSVECIKVSYRQEDKEARQEDKEARRRSRRGRGGPVPKIVIYPRLGRDNFGRALSGVYYAFKGLEGWGSGVVPRYSAPINPLISVAQSGGDFKKGLEDLKVLDNYFEKPYGAFQKGEEPPGSINGSANFDELYVALDLMGGVQGTQKFYPSDELKWLINQVRQGRLTSDYIPRERGLREKVEGLLAIERGASK